MNNEDLNSIAEYLLTLPEAERGIVIKDMPRGVLKIVNRHIIEQKNKQRLDELTQLDEDGQINYISGLSTDDIEMMIERCDREVIMLLITRLKQIYGSYDLQEMLKGVKHKVVDQLNDELKSMIQRIRDGEDDDSQGAYTAAVLSLGDNLRKKLGIALSKSLSFQFDEYRRAIEYMRQTRYDEWIEELYGGKGHGMG